MGRDSVGRLWIYHKSHKDMKKSVFLAYVPFSGLGLYNGFRGNRWLRNRIAVFKQFVLENLKKQTDQDFILWVSWRPEERNNKYVKELERYIRNKGFNYVFTYSGVCFWDDKYEDEEARERLASALHGSIKDLVDKLDCEYVDMLIQPSDDIYHIDTIGNMKNTFNSDPSIQAIGHQRGYMMDYTTKNMVEYNPKTNPPFFCIRFPKDKFVDTPKHMQYTGPYKSHEYIIDFLKMRHWEHRGFIVGTHQDNISTTFDHPYGGAKIEDKNILAEFGIDNVNPIVIPWSPFRALFKRLPYKVKRKLRYWAGDKKWVLKPVFVIIYKILRS